jgi:hypothetical protein
VSIKRNKRNLKTPPDHAFVPRGQFVGKNHGRGFAGIKLGAANPGRKLDPAEIAAVTERLREQGILR